jgi:GTP-binding protein
MNYPIVAIVGRPNVGKSTLFNRLMGRRLAITEDEPGTTRDRLYGTATWLDRTFTLVDTGGLDLDSESGIPAAIRGQAQLAINEADIILFVVDAVTGATPTDRDVANILRRSPKPTIVVVNKAENERRQLTASEFYELGFDELLPVSAYHGAGSDDLLDWVIEHLPATEGTETPPDGDVPEVRVAIIGRPNVGKSSLLNRLVGEERVVVSDLPGTTRDATDTVLQWKSRAFRLIDTAGIRKRGRIEFGTERYSVMRAMRALDQSDLALLLLDAVEGITDGDLHIAGFAQQHAKGLIVVVNKWDLVTKSATTTDDYARHIRDRLDFMPYVPVLFTSVLTGYHVPRILEEAARIWDERQKRVGTPELNNFVRVISARHTFTQRGKALKVLYATQAEVNPPTFVFFVNDPTLVHFGYRRFLENELRHAFGFPGTPIKIVMRGRQEEGEAAPRRTHRQAR